MAAVIYQFEVGVCDIYIYIYIYIKIFFFFFYSIFFWIFGITIIVRYFAECVIVLISEYRAQLQFMT